MDSSPKKKSKTVFTKIPPSMEATCPHRALGDPIVTTWNEFGKVECICSLCEEEGNKKGKFISTKMHLTPVIKNTMQYDTIASPIKNVPSQMDSTDAYWGTKTSNPKDAYAQNYHQQVIMDERISFQCKSNSIAALESQRPKSHTHEHSFDHLLRTGHPHLM